MLSGIQMEIRKQERDERRNGRHGEKHTPGEPRFSRFQRQDKQQGPKDLAGGEECLGTGADEETVLRGGDLGGECGEGGDACLLKGYWWNIIRNLEM